MAKKTKKDDPPSKTEEDSTSTSTAKAPTGTDTGGGTKTGRGGVPEGADEDGEEGGVRWRRLPEDQSQPGSVGE